LGRELGEHRNYSEDVAAKIDNEVDKIIKNCYQKALEVLRKNKAKLNKLAQKLIQKETIEGKELERLLGKRKERKRVS